MKFTREDPIRTARPAFESLPAAVAAAIAHGTLISEISLPRWAQSYPPATESDVESEFIKAMSKIPPNSIEGSEGK